MVIEVPLTQGQVALVDDADGELVASHRWRAERQRRTFYASTTVPASTPSGKTTLYMHRLILGLRRGDRGPDHINRNGLDNRRSNLRPATAAQNLANSPARSRVGLKGVYFHRHSGKWQAQIRVDGVRRTIGYYETPEAAHEAYREAARQAWGDFVEERA